MSVESSGIESSFVSTWEGWDEHGTSDLYFYDVNVLPGIFPEYVYDIIEKAKAEGKVIDLGLWGQTSQIELSIQGEEPFFSSRIRLTLVED